MVAWRAVDVGDAMVPKINEAMVEGIRGIVNPRQERATSTDRA
jgi:hypothetical protein